MSNRWTPHKGEEPRSPWLSRFLFRQAGFLDSEPFQKGFLHAPVCGWRLAAVLLSSSPGGALRVRRRESKGEAFVTRQRYEHPLAGAAGLPAPCAHSHRTQRRRQANGGTRGTGAGREPPRGERPHVPRARHASEVGDAVPRQGCARPATGRSPQEMSATARTCSSPTAARPPGRSHGHRISSDPRISWKRCAAANADPATRAPARRHTAPPHGPHAPGSWTSTQQSTPRRHPACACGTKGSSPSQRPWQRGWPPRCPTQTRARTRGSMHRFLQCSQRERGTAATRPTRWLPDRRAAPKSGAKDAPAGWNATLSGTDKKTPSAAPAALRRTLLFRQRAVEPSSAGAAGRPRSPLRRAGPGTADCDQQPEPARNWPFVASFKLRSTAVAGSVDEM